MAPPPIASPEPRSPLTLYTSAAKPEANFHRSGHDGGRPGNEGEGARLFELRAALG